MRECSRVLLVRAPIPLTRAVPSDLITPKGPTPRCQLTEDLLSTYGFSGGHFQSIAVTCGVEERAPG